ncbi:MAG: hypothetical protein LBQ80_00235 [Clostridium sp.]|jgi:hypothetical protein|nr:hypothetical protein [Clostridium sp.]
MLKSTTKRTGAFILGAVIVLLALVGVATLISLSARGVNSLLGDEAKKAEYEQFLSSVVRNDPDPFDDVSQAEPSQLIDCVLWSILQSNMETGSYEIVEFENSAGFQIPKADVEARFAELFGVTQGITHTTVDGGDYVFTYDQNKEVYLVPVTGIAPLYTPKVTDIQRKSRTIVLTVGYIPATEYALDDSGNVITPEPNKYRKITLRTTNDGYYISAIQQVAN